MSMKSTDESEVSNIAVIKVTLNTVIYTVL